ASSEIIVLGPRSCSTASRIIRRAAQASARLLLVAIRLARYRQPMVEDFECKGAERDVRRCDEDRAGDMAKLRARLEPLAFERMVLDAPPPHDSRFSPLNLAAGHPQVGSGSWTSWLRSFQVCRN